MRSSIGWNWHSRGRRFAMRTNPESERSQSDACINSTCQLGYGTEGQGLGADLHHAGSAQIAMPSPSRSNHLRKKRKNNNITRTSTSGGGQDKRARKQHRNVSPAAAAANNSATATQARQRDNQRALDEKRKERSRKRSGQKLEVLLKTTAMDIVEPQRRESESLIAFAMGRW